MSKVAVVGAGTMGNGIAHVFAQHGWDVTLVDLEPGSAPHLAVQGASQQLRAQADAQHGKPRLRRPSEQIPLGRQVRVGIGVVDPHGTPHHHQASQAIQLW